MTQKTLINILGLSVDTKSAVLYKADGSMVTIPQGDPRLPGIVATAKNAGLGVRALSVEVDITEIVIERGEFKDAEEGTKGLVKFFRVAKSFLKNLVDTESPKEAPKETAHITPVMLGLVPIADQMDQLAPNLSAAVAEDKQEAVGKLTATLAAVADKQIDDGLPTPLPAEGTVAFVALEREVSSLDLVNGTVGEIKPVEKTNDEKLQYAADKLEQLTSNGKQTSDPDFHKPMDESKETIVAVNTQTGAVIPDVQKLSPQLKSASKLQNYAGFTKFFERLSAIAPERGHSVEDLMKFIQNGDLPIADDGSIVIFKRLKPTNTKGVFVDVHSGNIRQKVGSYVFMRHGLVDPNRRQDCSNGLHVAALSYIGSFSGDVTILAKVNPEDVFAVPQYSHNKMRVCGYHILAELPESLRSIVNSGGSISSNAEGAVLLNNVLRGNHVGINQLVEIGGHRGTNVTYKDIVDTNDKSSVRTKEVVNTTLEVNLAAGEVPEPEKAEDVTPSDLKSAPPEKPSQKEFVRQQYEGLAKANPDSAHQIAVDLVALKTRTGKSWYSLGLKDEEAAKIHTYIRTASETQAPVKEVAKAKKPAKAKAAKAKKPKADKPASCARSASPRTIIRAAIDAGIAQNIEQIWVAKKQAKKGWDALGVTLSEQEEIKKHTK